MMEGYTKVLLIVTVFLGALSIGVKGGRVLKDEVDQPQNIGSFGGSLPNPGSIGSFPNPALGGGSFPNPGSLGGFPNPGSLGGSFPNPGSIGSFPNPGSVGGSLPNPGLGFGPSTFCAFGVPCGRVRPNSKGGASVGGSS